MPDSVARHPILLSVFAFALTACSNDGSVPRDDPTNTSVTPPTTAAPELSARGVSGRAAPAANGYRSVVTLEPQPAREFPPSGQVPVMDQVQLQFVPNVSLVRVGEPAEFHNSDEELHNLNVKESRTREQAFNVAVPTDGKYTHRLQKPGLYQVTCDIHPEMSALIVATSSPYAVQADDEGNFFIPGVQPGTYTVRAFGPTGTVERSVTVAAETGTEIDLASH
jgi:plastocyanin